MCEVAILSTDDLLVSVSTLACTGWVAAAVYRRSPGPHSGGWLYVTALSRCCVVLGAAASSSRHSHPSGGDTAVTRTFVRTRRLTTADSSFQYFLHPTYAMAGVVSCSVLTINNRHDLNKCIIVPNPSIYQAVNNTAIYLYLVHPPHKLTGLMAFKTLESINISTVVSFKQDLKMHCIVLT